MHQTDEQNTNYERFSSRRRKAVFLSTRHGRESRKESNRKYRRNHPDYLNKWRKANPSRARQHAINQRRGSRYRLYMKIYMRERRAKAKSAVEVQSE